jgi:hypothetical protein
MTGLELTKIEERLQNRLLFNVRAVALGERIDLPFDIAECGSTALDEAAVLRAALKWAEELVVALRHRLSPDVAA